MNSKTLTTFAIALALSAALSAAPVSDYGVQPSGQATSLKDNAQTGYSSWRKWHKRDAWGGFNQYAELTSHGSIIGVLSKKAKLSKMPDVCGVLMIGDKNTNIWYVFENNGRDGWGNGGVGDWFPEGDIGAGWETRYWQSAQKAAIYINPASSIATGWRIQRTATDGFGAPTAWTYNCFYKNASTGAYSIPISNSSIANVCWNASYPTFKANPPETFEVISYYNGLPWQLNLKPGRYYTQSTAIAEYYNTFTSMGFTQAAKVELHSTFTGYLETRDGNFDRWRRPYIGQVFPAGSPIIYYTANGWFSFPDGTFTPDIPIAVTTTPQ